MEIRNLQFQEQKIDELSKIWHKAIFIDHSAIQPHRTWNWENFQEESKWFSKKLTHNITNFVAPLNHRSPNKKWRHRLLWHCRRCPARRYVRPIPVKNLPRLRTSNVDRFNKRKCLYTGKGKKPTIPCTDCDGRGLRWWHSASGKYNRPVWRRQQAVEASMPMQTKRNRCAFIKIKKKTSSH